MPLNHKKKYFQRIYGCTVNYNVEKSYGQDFLKLPWLWYLHESDIDGRPEGKATAPMTN